jgi:endonuclease/exonuclease/phosphatase family metal-dependent hydrolase
LKANPRTSFITDLIVEVDKWKAAGAHIILGGDFNENLGESTDGLSNLVSTCNLTDVHAFFYDISHEPATYVRGSKRLDYVFVSEGVLPFVQSSGIEPFFTTVHSDHRGLFLDVDLTALLGGKLAKILPPALRGISKKFTQC